MRVQLCGFIIAISLSSVAWANSPLTEQELNAEVGVDTSVQDIKPKPPQKTYFFPAYNPASKIAEALWTKTQTYYDAHQASLGVRRYVTMVNLGLHNTIPRFYVLDLETGKITSYITSHGAGSDPDRNGFTDSFSNDINSKQSSLGVYLTLNTYKGRHGRSLRLSGQDSTNSNAQERAIVVHGAKYVSQVDKKTGMSWGCPALDRKLAQGVISKLMGGSLFVIDSIK